jgi:hypothetical protein
MLRIVKAVLLLLIWCIAGMVLGQETSPTVEIVLSRSTAQPGDIIDADVYIRNAVNIAGADVGITVDNACVRIIDRENGDFLPTKSEQGGFSAYSDLKEDGTRLAASLLGRSRIANGDGLFFRARLEVSCDAGTAPINVSYVELTQIEDPTAQNTAFIVYRMGEENTVSTTNAQLTIAPAAQATAVPTEAATDVPVVSTATPAPTAPVEAPQSTQTLLIVVIVLVMVLLIGLILFALARYLRRHR